MDGALLKEREDFLKRAMALPTVEKKIERPSYFDAFPRKPLKKPMPIVRERKPIEDETIPASQPINEREKECLGMLTKIVRHMRLRHLHGDSFPLTIEEILDETNQFHISKRDRLWLVDEGLINNSKIKVVKDYEYPTRFTYKPAFQLKDGKSLIRLLKQYAWSGHGGILLDDIEESLSDYEKILKSRADEIIFITRPKDKNKVLFYKDTPSGYQIISSWDEDLTKLWRKVTVDILDNSQIEEYLKKKDSYPMQECDDIELFFEHKKKEYKKRQPKLRHNKHVADVLQSYDNKPMV